MPLRHLAEDLCPSPNHPHFALRFSRIVRRRTRAAGRRTHERQQEFSDPLRPSQWFVVAHAYESSLEAVQECFGDGAEAELDNHEACGKSRYGARDALRRTLSSRPREGWRRVRGTSTAYGRTFGWCLVLIGKASNQRNVRTMRASERKYEFPARAGEEARSVDAVAGRRRAEDALRESEERYRRLVELSPASIAVHSGGKFVYANAAGARLLGAAEAEELIGKPVLDFVHPDHAEFVKRRIRRNQEQGEPTELAEIKMVRLDGEVIDVETRGIPVTYEGHPATQVFILDITERRRAEREKAKVVEEYEAIIRVLPNVVFRWRKGTDGEMHPTYIEGALAEEFGVTTEWAAGKTIEELFPAEFQETVVSAFERAFAGETVEFPSRIGDRIFANVAMPFHADGRRNPDEGASADEIVGFVSDVTERSRAEAEIRRLNGVLESRVAERTAQLEATVSKLEANERMLRESRADVQRSREELINSREEERRRLRRDLHDGLGPALAGLAFCLDAARDKLAPEQEDVDALLSLLKRQTQEAVSDVRRLVYGLRPPALDDLGLVPAVREQAAKHGRLHGGGLRGGPLPAQDAPGRAEGGGRGGAARPEGEGTVFSVEAPEDLPPLPAAVEAACYRIAQEAMTNVARHAGAERCSVWIWLDAAEGALKLEVADDGTGLPEGWRAGVGTVSMRERAAELGGTCSLAPSPWGGARVSVSLPLPAAHGREG